jgi:4-oxalocrotonate tautomerase
MLRGKPPQHRAALSDAIDETLRDVAGVAADDRPEVITEHDPDDLNIISDSIGVHRNSDAILVQPTLNQDCTLDQKRVLYAAIVQVLHQKMGLRPEDIASNVLEANNDDWSFSNVIATTSTPSHDERQRRPT